MIWNDDISFEGFDKVEQTECQKEIKKDGLLSQKLLKIY